MATSASTMRASTAAWPESKEPVAPGAGPVAVLDSLDVSPET
ncbi:hypothetical protein AZ78_4195 [Lysobacter capsici AZ78]|uniref:Uncharacterized protein n=1 Tax=Lysobacter capsici AZ78 TaxID=1444315 RepID=A0A108UCE5_9GAMM|nr:hypothetical protein AZ78_4195 [Lysobacter capsici AZ78]